jgi:hypothetical protein
MLPNIACRNRRRVSVYAHHKVPVLLVMLCRGMRHVMPSMPCRYVSAEEEVESEDDGEESTSGGSSVENPTPKVSHHSFICHVTIYHKGSLINHSSLWVMTWRVKPGLPEMTCLWVCLDAQVLQPVMLHAISCLSVQTPKAGGNWQTHLCSCQCCPFVIMPEHRLVRLTYDILFTLGACTMCWLQCLIFFGAWPSPFVCRSTSTWLAVQSLPPPPPRAVQSHLSHPPPAPHLSYQQQGQP